MYSSLLGLPHSGTMIWREVTMVAGGQAKVRQFGKFLLYRHLRSEGECIESFACKKKDTAEEVEIRILKVAANKNSPLLKRFVHELKMVARLRHPAIIRVLEAGVTDGRGYFTTPLRKSMRLEDFMEKRGKGLPAKDVLSCAEIITDAIALMHQAKIIHRTLSPTSVHVDLERRFPLWANVRPCVICVCSVSHLKAILLWLKWWKRQKVWTAKLSMKDRTCFCCVPSFFAC